MEQCCRFVEISCNYNLNTSLTGTSIHKNYEVLKEMGILKKRILDSLTCLLRNLYAGQEATVRLDMEQQTGSRSGKQYVKAVYCHPAYLTYMQSIS